MNINTVGGMTTYNPQLAVMQFTNNVQLLLQQRGSRLSGAALRGDHIGSQAAAVDQFAPVTAAVVTTQYNTLNSPANTPSNRRWVQPTNYQWYDMVDNFTKLLLLNDPTSHYVTNGTYAMGRAMDLQILSAFFGNSVTGEMGASTTAFPAAQIIPVATGAASACGLNVAKLIMANQMLMAANVDMENDTIYCAITAAQHANLLNEIQVNSLDFNSRAVLVDGKVTSFMGINFIHTEMINYAYTPTANVQTIPCWAKSGMHLGVWNELTANVSQRYDLSSLPYQVYLRGTFGATRLEEAKVVQIPCLQPALGPLPPEASILSKKAA